jgi:hypothetical protein
MWNRRDYVILATAAFASFGLTVATLWPRLANAVDQVKVTNDVQVPTLDLAYSQVTAAMDPAKPHTVLLTVRNSTNNPATAGFAAQADKAGPSSPFSRVGPPSAVVWSQEFAIDLNPGETKVIAVDLPEVAFVAADEGASQAQVSRLTIPGRSYLTLRSKDTPKQAAIMALVLSNGSQPTAAAQANGAGSPVVSNGPISAPVTFTR